MERVFDSGAKWEDDGWQQVWWQDWRTVAGSTLADYHFPNLDLARQHLWGRKQLDDHHIAFQWLEGNNGCLVCYACTRRLLVRPGEFLGVVYSI